MCCGVVWLRPSSHHRRYHPPTYTSNTHNTPTPPQNKNTKCRYTFEAGPIRFIVMNFEKDFAPGSPQYAFVSQDLAERVDRARTPWVRVCVSYWYGLCCRSERDGGWNKRPPRVCVSMLRIVYVPPWMRVTVASQLNPQLSQTKTLNTGGAFGPQTDVCPLLLGRRQG